MEPGDTSGLQHSHLGAAKPVLGWPRSPATDGPCFLPRLPRQAGLLAWACSCSRYVQGGIPSFLREGHWQQRFPGRPPVF